ncbi:MAG TPA: tetratricopeptide repeat protein [Vicinamibacterales bacterium]|nr:tetratricopeptide repeat protein [Vicinamibacterales bacterium]
MAPRKHPRERGTRTWNAEPGTRNREPGTTWRAAVVALAAAVVYLNSLSAPFSFDDQIAVVDNRSIRSIGDAWSQPHNTPLAGRPITGVTFALNFATNGTDPAAYRATNIAIHISCALLLFGLVRRTLALPRWQAWAGGGAPDVAFAVALLWAVHPLTTDAVTYITQRTESLMGLCYVLTLYASLRSHRRSKIDDRQSTPDAGRWTMVAVCACALGMGAKESMVTAPVMVVLFDRAFVFDSFRAAIAARWRLYGGLALTWPILAWQIVSTPRSGSAGFATGISVWTYLLNQSVMIMRYLRLAVWPTDLVINYGPPVPYTLVEVLPYASFLAVLLVLTLVAMRWNAAVAFPGAWFFITLAPSSSFVPIATEVGAERRMYLPLMAVVAGVVFCFYKPIAPRRGPSAHLATVALACVVIVSGGLTIARNAEHQSWMTLAQTTLDRWPTDVAHAAVGGELSRLRRDEEALPLLRIGARSDVRARYNLGITLFNLNRYDEAIRELQVLVDEHPMREEAPWARRVMGHAYARLGRWSDAIAQLRTTLAMTPLDAEARALLVDAHNSYGVDLAQAQKYTEAIAEFRSALAVDPRNASAQYNLATALFDAGQLEDAFAQSERALALNPTNADAHHLVGKLLALQGRLGESLISLETAVKLRPEDPVIREDLERVRRVRQ